MLAYVRGFIVLFVLLTLLLYLPPGKSYQKYIRFFAELIMTLGILSPVLSVVCDSDEFLKQVEYEEFMENLSELSRDADRIAYINNDYYLAEYENAIEMDVEQIAEEYGFSAQDVKVHMTENYTIDEMRLWLTDQSGDVIVIGEIVPEDGGEEEEEEDDAVYAGLKQELSEYYQLEPSRIEIQYTRAR